MEHSLSSVLAFIGLVAFGLLGYTNLMAICGFLFLGILIDANRNT